MTQLHNIRVEPISANWLDAQKDKEMIDKQLFAMYLVKWFNAESLEGWINDDYADRILCGNTWQSAGFEILAEYELPYGGILTYVRKSAPR